MNEYFSNCKNPVELDTRYQQMRQALGIDFMPDHVPLKQEFLQEFRDKRESFARLPFKPESEATERSMEEIVQWVKSNNFKAERIGRWIWVPSQGITTNRDEFKRMGFRFSQSKQSYYWRADKDRSSNPNPLSIDAIRRKYGSKSIGISH